jgi:hypothetical protein
MICPSCGHAAGDAEFCPSCLTAIPREAAAAPAPATETPPATQAAPAAPSSPERWQRTALMMAVAAALGIGAAALLSRRGASADPECVNLCQFAEIPAVASNERWQEQVATHHCACNALPKNPPPAQPVLPPATGP